MKFCIYGAGAIGGYLAVELAVAGHAVCVIARGAHLEGIRKNGLRLRIAGAEKTVSLPASEDPRSFGPQDYVISTLKAHQAYECADKFTPLFGDDTALVMAVNGIPWWYFYAQERFKDRHLESVDPNGRQWHLIRPERAIGCVVDPACEVIEPGVIVHHEFNRFILGEPSGKRTERLARLQEALIGAGFDAPVRDDIRWNIWLKLWGNVCFNPISLLTHATLDRITTEPGLRALCEQMMKETSAVSEALGIHIPSEMMERRLAAAGKAVGHKMSMLQDLERGRSLEIDALVTAVQELGRLTNVPTPLIDAILALAQERGRALGLYQPLAAMSH